NSSRYDQSKSTNYGFVSPNTLDNSRFDDAIKNLNSPEELKLMNKTLNLGCRVGQNVKVYKAVGSWRDGAEHSVLITLTSDEKRMRYFVSRLGKYSRQKAVLYFHQQPGGKATIYILYSPGQRTTLRDLAFILDQAGVSFRTLVPLRRGTIIYVVDTDGQLRANVMVAARQLRTQVRSKSGTAAFIGDDSD